MSKLIQIIAEVLQMPEAEISDHTSPNTAKAWDSMTHVDLVLAIEAGFGVTFSTSEIMSVTSVAAARELLQGKGVG